MLSFNGSQQKAILELLQITETVDSSPLGADAEA
jgi:hypothetical protein